MSNNIETFTETKTTRTMKVMNTTCI